MFFQSKRKPTERLHKFEQKPNPLSPRFMPFTTSFTPLFKHLCSAAITTTKKKKKTHNHYNKLQNHHQNSTFTQQTILKFDFSHSIFPHFLGKQTALIIPLRTSLRVRLQSFFPARGLAMGARAWIFFLSFWCDFSASLSLPIVFFFFFWNWFSNGRERENLLSGFLLTLLLGFKNWPHTC